MSITPYPNGISSFGVPVLPFAIPPGGKHYFVDPANGNDSSAGTSHTSALATLEEAEDRCVANQNDCVFLIPGSSGQNLTAALTWDKNYTHLIGLGPAPKTANRNRIFQLSTLTGASPLLTVSASGCMFANWYLFQGVDDATSLINVRVSGGRNHFYRVHFAGGGHATQAIDGGASLQLIGDSAEENLFEECTIGVDTIDAATGMVGLLLDNTTHRNEFDRCRFRMRAGNSGAAFVEVTGTDGIDRDTIFDNCIFINNHTSAAMASAFVIPAGVNLPRTMHLKDPYFHGVTKIDAADSDGLYTNSPGAITAADLNGVAVVAYE